MIKRVTHLLVSILIVCLLTNTIVWAFSGEVFNHAIKSEHHVLSLDPNAHYDAHQHDPSIDHNFSNTANFCLHSAGQCLPFFFYSALDIPLLSEKERLFSLITASYLQIYLESPLRPPNQFL
jgi:hypothetical protein